MRQKILAGMIIFNFLLCVCTTSMAEDKPNFPMGSYGRMLENINQLRMVAAKTIKDSALFQGLGFAALFYGEKQTWEDSGGGLDNTNTNGQPQKSREMYHRLPMVPSVDMFAAIMNSKDYTDMVFDLTTSQAAVYNISVALSEPGILQGGAAAVAAANAFTLNRYASETAMVEQFANFPEYGKGAARAYFACLYDNMGSGSGSKEERLLRAHAQCNGDEYNPKNSNPSSPQGGSQRIFTGDHFTFKDDPNVDQNNGADDSTQVRLTDILFGSENQAAQAQMGNPNQPAGQTTDYGTLAGDFRTYIGDYIITGAKPQGGNQGKGLEITFVRVAPTKLPSDVFNELTARTYSDQLTAFNDYCRNFLHASDAKTGLSYRNQLFTQSNCDAKSNPDSFCSILRKNSVPGFEQSLYSVDFQVKQLLSLAEGKDDKACDVFNDKLKLQTLTGKPEDVTPETLVLFMFSEGIAMQKMLMTFKKVEEIAQKLTAGSFPSDIRELTFNMIHEAAHSKNIQLEFDQGIDRLNHLVSNLPKVMAIASRGGQAVTAPFKGRTGRGIPNNAS